MKKFEIVQNYREINWRNKHEIEEGCTTKQDNQQAKVLESFDNKDEALQELWKYRTDITKYSGSAGTYYAITEYYVEENIYNKDGEWVEGGDIWEYSKMPEVETGWKELALENEDQIKDKMREAFKESIGDITDSWQYSVQLYEDGEVDIHFLSQNSTTTGIFNGEAIEICHFTRFSLSDLDMDWHIENWLEDDEKESFEAWKEETGLDDIEEWSEEVYSRIEEERRQDFIDEYMETDIESKWDGFFEMLDNN